MKVVIQRVNQAQVNIGSTLYNSIDKGMCIFLGITHQDGEEDVHWLIKKILGLRIFDDENSIMNLNINQVSGDILVISQFTLYASTKKGNRPSYIEAAHPSTAENLYDYFISQLSNRFEGTVKTGKFAADMKVNLINDGPVTILIDTKDKI
jgi:D-aminoacyl-tRNA deacylase